MTRLPVFAIVFSTGLLAPVWLAVAQSAGSVAAAQDRAKAAFEVASVKPHLSGDRRFMIRPSPGGRFDASGATLKMLIGVAYRIQDYQIVGGPNWIATDRFDIVAKTEDGTNSKWMECLQSLLEDRFKLKAHSEGKEMPTYGLEIAKGGSKLRESAGECPPRPSGLPPPPPPGQLPTPPCGGMFGGLGHFFGDKVPLQQLVTSLARILERTVIDKTGLTGKYDIRLEWTPDPGQAQFGSGEPPLSPEPQADSAGPSIFTALQEQLGLRLVSQKGPVETFTVDRAERPGDN